MKIVISKMLAAVMLISVILVQPVSAEEESADGNITVKEQDETEELVVESEPMPIEEHGEENADEKKIPYDNLTDASGEGGKSVENMDDGNTDMADASADMSVILEEDVKEEVQKMDSYSVSGEERTADGLCYKILGDGTVEITGYTVAPSGVLTIPGTIGGYTVSSIGYMAFAGCLDLTGIKLSEGLINIGDYAFSPCSNLKGELELPTTLKSIGKAAFSGCSGLTGTLRLPEGLTSIESSTFASCSGLTGVLKLPDNITGIGNNAFSGCSGLTGLELSGGLTSIGDYAFNGCNGLKGTLQLPDGLTSIGKYAFYNRQGLTGVLKLPDRLTSIGDYAFGGCSGFTGELVLPDGLTSIGDYVFYGCSGFTGELVLPQRLTGIGKYSFCNCSSFTGKLSLPDGLTKIGEHAFSSCSGFTGELKLPKGLTSIENATFSGCSGLTGKVVLPEGLISIGNEAFYGCSGLTGELALPGGLMSIGSSAFHSCSGLTGKVVLPERLTSIGQYAFYGCSQLTGAEIFNSATIGEWALGYTLLNEKIENFIIICNKNSTAEKYAKDNNILYCSDHQYTSKTTKAATCSSVGEKTYTCALCGHTYTEAIAKTAHTYKTTTVKAAIGKNGNITKKCSVCNVTETTPIYAPKTVTLTQSYYYDGKVKTPAVTVKDSAGNLLKKGTDYEVIYAKGRKNIGNYTVTVNFKGNYEGTVKKTFKIAAKKGATFTSGTGKYKVVNSSSVAFAGLKSSKTTKLTIPATVKYGGKSFKVTSIGDKALQKTKVKSVVIGTNVTKIGKSTFLKCTKLKSVTIKTTKLKSVGKNAFQGINATAKIKVPSKKLKAYNKLLKGKGQGKKVKIVK